jgi:hypothetical protein
MFANSVYFSFRPTYSIPVSKSQVRHDITDQVRSLSLYHSSDLCWHGMTLSHFLFLFYFPPHISFFISCPLVQSVRRDGESFELSVQRLRSISMLACCLQAIFYLHYLHHFFGGSSLLLTNKRRKRRTRREAFSRSLYHPPVLLLTHYDVPIIRKNTRPTLIMRENVFLLTARNKLQVTGS